MIFTQEAPLTRRWFPGRSCIRSNWNLRQGFRQVTPKTGPKGVLHVPHDYFSSFDQSHLICCVGVAIISLALLVLMWRHGGHIGVQNNSEKGLLGIWFYYYAKPERHFAIVLYTNMPSHHVSENQELVFITLFTSDTTSNRATETKCVQI